jgi:hypothetical protein
VTSTGEVNTDLSSVWIGGILKDLWRIYPYGKVCCFSVWYKGVVISFPQEALASMCKMEGEKASTKVS